MTSFRRIALATAGTVLLAFGVVLVLAAIGAAVEEPDRELGEPATVVRVLTDEERGITDAPAAPDDQPVLSLPDTHVEAASAPEPDPPIRPVEEPSPTSMPDGPTRTDGDALLVAATGTSTDPVDAGGRSVTYSVEVEWGTGLDPVAVAAVVESALYDERSWARDHELRRVAPQDADIHLVVATPATVDAICARAGLRTNGWLSCWSGDTAAINLDRWQSGSRYDDDLERYRRYVVNHEIGHGLGHGHSSCTGSGHPAPVMQQQTKGLDGCTPNEWPHP